MILYKISFWLILFLVGLPQFAETVYIPSLPTIGQFFQTTANMMEYTLSIYLFGFAFGTLFWGRISDKYGRKKCVLIGLIIFILGCLGCYYSQSITHLLAARFLQAFGGSVGSVLGQAICRDAFTGKELMNIFRSIGMALAIFPAVGPIIGGWIVSYTGYENIFLFLMFFALSIFLIVISLLPETHPKHSRQKNHLFDIFKQLCNDSKVRLFSVLIGLSNGIGFSYFSEGSFYFIDMLGLDPYIYGFTFIPISASYFSSGFITKKLQNKYQAIQIIGIASKVILSSTGFLSLLILCKAFFPTSALISLTLCTHMITCLGLGMIMSNALPIALIDYKHCTGTASSLFGFSYYLIISLCTFVLGFFRNGNLIVMPLFFLFLAMMIFAAYKKLSQINI